MTKFNLRHTEIADICNPKGISIDPRGNLVIADYGSYLVRLVKKPF
jgi:hypothetical protein